MSEDKVEFVVQYRTLWREHSLQMLVLHVAVVAAGAAVGYALASTARATEEPPIRVKGGSLELYLDTFTGSDSWTFDEGTWIAKYGKRNGKSKTLVTMLPTSTSAGCSNLYDKVKDPITITFKDTANGTEYPVTFNVKDHGGATKEPKMSVDPGTLALKPDASDELELSNKDEGFISSVQIGTQSPCLYTKDDNVDVYLYPQK